MCAKVAPLLRLKRLRRRRCPKCCHVDATAAPWKQFADRKGFAVDRMPGCQTKENILPHPLLTSHQRGLPYLHSHVETFFWHPEGSQAPGPVRPIGPTGKPFEPESCSEGSMGGESRGRSGRRGNLLPGKLPRKVERLPRRTVQSVVETFSPNRGDGETFWGHVGCIFTPQATWKPFAPSVETGKPFSVFAGRGVARRRRRSMYVYVCI